MSDTTPKKKSYRAVGFLIIGFLALLVIPIHSNQIMLATDFGQNLVFSHLTMLGTFALFMERAIAVFLSAWRSEDADHLDAASKLFQNEFTACTDEAKKSDIQTKINEATKERTQYRTKSRHIAQIASLGLGLIVALLGVQALGALINPDSISHKDFFALVDVVITAGVLAGGSNSINILTSTFNTLMVSTAAKAKG
ncbi:MAG: hypothetical protein QNL04_00640 [SAR324 cluster bacterium]|nr:hypothetical protein [SAR324 cluster bacterium]